MSLFWYYSDVINSLLNTFTSKKNYLLRDGRYWFRQTWQLVKKFDCPQSFLDINQCLRQFKYGMSHVMENQICITIERFQIVLCTTDNALKRLEFNFFKLFKHFFEFLRILTGFKFVVFIFDDLGCVKSINTNIPILLSSRPGLV